jgi:hypothetical protein
LHRKRSRAIRLAAITICSHVSPTSMRAVCSASPNGADGLFGAGIGFSARSCLGELRARGGTRLNERADERHVTSRTTPPSTTKAVSTPRTHAARRLRLGRVSGGSHARARLHGRPVGDDGAHGFAATRAWASGKCPKPKALRLPKEASERWAITGDWVRRVSCHCPCGEQKGGPLQLGPPWSFSP